MRHILVVDDSATMRRMIIASLRTLCDVTFSEANNGLEALERLIIAPVDLMTIDLNMPDMHGSEVVRFVRTQERYQQLPIIVISTRGDESSQEDLLEAGASAYVVKPFTPGMLADQARLLLQGV
ncbi:response regulator [Chloroflexia bacterium SDU3-3]|nr:response regulator [Chloroflexia bacterium SDU3-3]